MKLEITTLSENTAISGGFIAEWGLSMLIEVGGTRLLFDTGAGFAAVHNAQLLGVDLSSVDRIVLSHAHYDHTGGLKEVLTRTGPVDIIAHPAIWEPKYAVREQNGKHSKRYIGIPFCRDQLEGLGGCFQLTSKPEWITDDVVTSGEVPMTTDYEEVDPDLFIREGEVLKPDTFFDDLSLAVKTELGLVIILGCAHRGMVNTIRHFQQITSIQSVYCVIGGTHLLRASDERLARTVTDLRGIGIQRLGVSHCTGFGASVRLSQEFCGKFFLNNAGMRFGLI